METPRDTSKRAHLRQLDALRSMTGTQRVAIAIEMTDEIRAMTAAGIRARHPDHTEAEVEATLEAILLGPDLAGKVRTARRDARHRRRVARDGRA